MDTRTSSTKIMSELPTQDCTKIHKECNKNVNNEPPPTNCRINGNEPEEYHDHGDDIIIPEVFTCTTNRCDHSASFAGGETKACVPHTRCSCDNNSKYPTTQSLPLEHMPKFTPKMIQDQELLVSSLNQQGFSEEIIHRHFNRLYEEQCRQLQLMEKQNTHAVVKKSPKKEDAQNLHKTVNSERMVYNHQEKACCLNGIQDQVISNPSCACHSQSCANSPQQEPQMNCHQHENRTCCETHRTCCERNRICYETNRTCCEISDKNRFSKIEPSSLLKIRLQKEIHSAKNKNNGLQEDAVAAEILQNSKAKYESSKQVPVDEEEVILSQLRLNGTQDKSEMEKFQAIYAPESIQRTQEKRFSNNGLENSRNLNNPQWAPKTARCRARQMAHDGSGTLYPPQKQYFNQQHHPQIVNSYCGCNVQEQLSKNPQCCKDKGLAHHQTHQHCPEFSSNYVEQQQSQCNQNYSTTPQHWAGILEPKVYGGLMYYATADPAPQSNPPMNKLEYISCNCVEQPTSEN